MGIYSWVDADDILLNKTLLLVALSMCKTVHAKSLQVAFLS